MSFLTNSIRKGRTAGLCGTCVALFAIPLFHHVTILHHHRDSDDLPSAEEILDRHAASTGTSEAHAQLTSRVMKGTLNADIAGHALEAQVVVQSISPNCQRTVIESPHINLVKVTNGTAAWEWRSSSFDHGDGDNSGSNTRRYEGRELQQTLEQGLFRPESTWRDRIESAENVGVKELAGRDAYEIQITSKDGEEYTQFFDCEHGRLVGYERTVDSPGLGTLNMQVEIGGYRQIDGVWIATEIKQSFDVEGFGEGTQVWRYDEIKHNVDIPSSLFELPTEIADRS